jgi:hypothetical protein
VKVQINFINKNLCEVAGVSMTRGKEKTVAENEGIRHTAGHCMMGYG